MRLVTYLPSRADAGSGEPLRSGRPGALLRSGQIADLPELARAARLDLPLTSMLALLGGGAPVLDRVRALVEDIERRLGAGERLSGEVVRSADEARLLAPVPRPGKILCTGVNYRDHVDEVPGRSLPEEPSIFAKLPSVVVGPYDAIHHPGPPHTVDYEVELACVIGRTGRAIPRERALDHVAGYTILNDVSARDVQFKNNQITMGKNFDTFAPTGPCLATPDELGDPQDVEVRCWVNGEPRQRARTSAMAFDIPTLIAWVSHACTLEPGDLISTGTPAGVGAFRQPPRFLEPGDVVRMEIDGIGAIENRVV